MTTRHLLTCACGKTHEVDTTQAGQTITCECGQSLQVPTLRGIKQLPVAESKPVKRATISRTGASSVGCLFLFALVIYLIAAGTGVVSAVFRGGMLFTPIEAIIQARDEELDLKSIDQTILEWEFLSKEKLGATELNLRDELYKYAMETAGRRDMAKRLEWLAYIGSIIAIISFIVTVGCWFQLRKERLADT